MVGSRSVGYSQTLVLKPRDIANVSHALSLGSIASSGENKEVLFIYDFTLASIRHSLED